MEVSWCYLEMFRLTLVLFDILYYFFIVRCYAEHGIAMASHLYVRLSLHP